MYQWYCDQMNATNIHDLSMTYTAKDVLLQEMLDVLVASEFGKNMGRSKLSVALILPSLGTKLVRLDTY
jgi:hypothetical protein